MLVAIFAVLFLVSAVELVSGIAMIIWALLNIVADVFTRKDR